jgi:hypothetical protein
MITIEQIVYVIPILGLTASIFYYAIVIRNQNKTRQAQLFIQICNQTLNNPAFMKGYYIIRDSEWNDYDEYLEYLGEPGSENYNDIFLVGGILESIGVLVEEGLVDIRLIESLMRRVVIEYYEKMKPMLDERARVRDQNLPYKH